MNIKYACIVNNRRFSILSRTLFALILVFISAIIPARAGSLDGSFHMILNGRSYHMDKPRNGQSLNENNFGTGMQYEFRHELGSKWVPFVTSSAFSDSFNNLSYYVGGGEYRRYPLGHGWHFDMGYVAFLMARKDINNYDPFPGILPVVSMGTRKLSVNMTYVPRVKEGFAELLFFQLKIATPDW